MQKLTQSDLMSLEQYAKQRKEFRSKVIEHKKTRQVHLGEHACLYFEDRLTMQYQIQEMLRIEKIFEEDGILDELNAYNPLIPDGSNLKATFMIEYDDEGERKQALARMVGIEDKVWIQVDGFDKVFAIADEDLERENADKTSSVHFLRFEFSPEMVSAAKAGADMNAGIEHPAYQASMLLASPVRDALTADFT